MKGRTFKDKLDCAIEGIGEAVGTQLSLRLEIYGALILTAIAIFLPLTRFEWAALILTEGFVLTAEMINTAVEILSDAINPHFDPEIRRVKDVLAGAVLLSLAIGLSTVWLIFSPYLEPLFRSVLAHVQTANIIFPLVLILLALALILPVRKYSSLSYRAGLPSGYSALGFGGAAIINLLTKNLLIGAGALILAFLIAQSRVVARIYGWWEVLLGGLIGIGFAILIMQVLGR